VTAVTYPSQSSAISVNNVFDSMSRLSGITVTDGGNTVAWASNAQYGVRGEMTSLTWGGGSTTMTESRTYNVLGQMTRMTVQNQIATKYTDIEYAFSSTANNGRATYAKDWMSGEQVNYSYDTLNRLITAETQGSGGWGNSYSFDGFGNLLTKAVTKGSAPALSQAADWATNRIIGLNYDANGNQKPQGSGNWYDIENRLISWDNGTFYGYAPSNKRVLKKTSTTEDYSFWVSGKVIGVYRWNGTVFTEQSRKVHFGGRVIAPPASGAGKAYDRLGSEVRDGSTVRQYFPWGEDRQNSTEFATYPKDGESGLKYADQRYYNSAPGRFLTPDPYQNSAGADAPDSWNRYSYTRGDPVSRVDPQGLEDSATFTVTGYCMGCSGGLDGPGGPGGGFGSLGLGGSGGAKGADLFALDLGNSEFVPEPDLYIFIQPTLPPGNQYTQQQITDLTNGLNNAVSHLDNIDCATLFFSGSDDPRLAAVELLANTMYRILVPPPGSPTAGAWTADDRSVFIDPGGAFFIAGANANGTVTVNMPNRVNAAMTPFTFANVESLRAFILLHELGHQAGRLGPDTDRPTNAANSGAVLDNCFKKSAAGVYY
jgi:RHS repeat-associated protein